MEILNTVLYIFRVIVTDVQTNHYIRIPGKAKTFNWPVSPKYPKKTKKQKNRTISIQSRNEFSVADKRSIQMKKFFKKV